MNRFGFWRRAASVTSGMLRHVLKFSVGWHKLLSSFVALLAIQLSACELVKYIRPDGVNATISWSQAGADFEPHISSACDSMISVESRDDCSSALRELFLAADLKLWNAIDGRNLTWQQRPPRELPEHLLRDFTMGGRVQHLHGYRSDAHSYRVAYSADDIAALIDNARARNVGAAYPQIDIRLFSSAARPLCENIPACNHRQPTIARHARVEQLSPHMRPCSGGCRPSRCHVGRARYRVRLHQAVVRERRHSPGCCIRSDG